MAQTCSSLCLNSHRSFIIGGTFYLETGLQYMRNFGDNAGNQFSSVPVRIGYSQSLIGFNQFKWDKKIEPLEI